VDDVLSATTNHTLKTWFLDSIQKNYKITISDPLTEFICMSISRDFQNRTITLRQPDYHARMENKFKYLLSKNYHLNYPITPMSAIDSRQSKSTDNLSDKDQELYMSLVGS
jgi:hypothetical protein